MPVSEDEATWRQNRTEWLDAAKKRPAMFIGVVPRAHTYFVREPLRLVWQAKVFRRPVAASVLLSPMQYVVRCFTGPLIRPVQQLYSWGGKRALDDDWHEPHNSIKNEDIRRILNDQPRLRGWRKHFASPTGQNLNSPMNVLCLAPRFAIGYRVDQGMWCQTFESGWPDTAPFLLSGPLQVGIMAAAELDRKWFTGLPFTRTDAERLALTPKVEVEWHDEDDLLPHGSLSVQNFQNWIR